LGSEAEAGARVGARAGPGASGMAPDRHIFTMGQAHFAVKVPVRKEGGISAQLLILYSASIVKRINPILYSLNYII
jgi:hypothetical protein